MNFNCIALLLLVAVGAERVYCGVTGFDDSSLKDPMIFIREFFSSNELENERLQVACQEIRNYLLVALDLFDPDSPINIPDPGDNDDDDDSKINNDIMEQVDIDLICSRELKRPHILDFVSEKLRDQIEDPVTSSFGYFDFLMASAGKRIPEIVDVSSREQLEGLFLELKFGRGLSKGFKLCNFSYRTDLLKRYDLWVASEANKSRSSLERRLSDPEIEDFYQISLTRKSYSSFPAFKSTLSLQEENKSKIFPLFKSHN